MIVKLIRCDVLEHRRDDFASGQRAWRILAALEGFLGQSGGWALGGSNEAVIVALWKDQSAYDRFMRDHHDAILSAIGQRGTYQGGSVSIWHRLLDMPGCVARISDAISQAEVIRIAQCTVKDGRNAHFEAVQRDIWNPGMATAGGMLGGAFSREPDNSKEYLVCTFWRTAADHSAYRNEIFASLRERAKVDDDCESVERTLVDIEPTWRVPTSSCA